MIVIDRAVIAIVAAILLSSGKECDVPNAVNTARAIVSRVRRDCK